MSWRFVGCGALMEGVVGWFEKRGEIPLVPPPAVREDVPVADDPDKPGGDYSTVGVRGVAFAIEYCDARGWTSIRTIRCLGIDTRHPASLTAYCHAREKVSTFRVDRIISIMDLRSGRFVSAEEHQALLAPYLPQDDPDPELIALVDVQNATRDGVFALLPLAMPGGRLGHISRAILADYVKAEANALGLKPSAFETVELWIDNLSPPFDAVAASVTSLLEDKDRFARLLPWLLKIVRTQEGFAEPEQSVRDLIAEVRTHFGTTPSDRSNPIRAQI